MDITPHDNGEREILFLHDAGMVYSGQSIGNVRLAITRSPLAAELVDLGNMIKPSEKALDLKRHMQ